MRVFKSKLFSKWAEKEGLSDATLLFAVEEIVHGLIDADLGGHVLKKRIAVGRRGKSGGVRTVLAYRVEDKAFFVYGFAKNVRANISVKDLKSLKLLAAELLSYSSKELHQAVKHGELIEVINDG